MNSRQLEYFLAVARELNFTKAAESMFVSQTAVTQQIKVLEEQLGVHLFERTKRKVALTPAGRVFQEEAVDILKRIDLAAQRTRAVSSGFTGSLNVGFALGIGNTEVAERIQAFHQKYPNISMKFVNHSPSMLMKSLRSGEVDLILMPLFDEAFYGDIAYRKIAWDNLIAVLPKNHRLAQNQYITWRELTTILIVDDVVPAVRRALRSKFARAKNTAQSRSAIRSQVIVELEKKVAEEIIEDYGEVTVSASEDDPTVCLVDFAFTVAHGLNQIWLTAHIVI